MKKFSFLLVFFVGIDFILKYLAVKFLPTGGIYFFKKWLGLELFYNIIIKFIDISISNKEKNANLKGVLPNSLL